MIRYSPPSIPPIQDAAARIVIAQLRWFPPGLRNALREQDPTQDLFQECYTIALEIVQEGIITSPDVSRPQFREASRFAQRKLYRFLTAYGFHRGKREKGFHRREEPIYDRLPGDGEPAAGRIPTIYEKRWGGKPGERRSVENESGNQI